MADRRIVDIDITLDPVDSLRNKVVVDGKDLSDSVYGIEIISAGTEPAIIGLQMVGNLSLRGQAMKFEGFLDSLDLSDIEGTALERVDFDGNVVEAIINEIKDRVRDAFSD